MFSANTYRIHSLGRVLIGEIDGAPAAAISLDDGRVIAGRSARTGHLAAFLRMRAAALRAQEAVPSLRERILSGVPAAYRARPRPALVAAPASRHVVDAAERTLAA
jgi:hypothetical protein